MKKLLMTLTLAMAAMIAIPTAANAQDNKSSQAKECCKDKKDCKDENCQNADCKNADCKKEGVKHSMKKGKGKKAMRAKSGQAMRADGRKMKAHKEGRMHKGMRRAGGENPMFKGITLSDEQKTKMKALREKNMAAEKKTKADMKAKSKEEMQKLRADFDKEVEKILDKDQLKQFKANKAEMEARRAAKQDKLPKIEKKDK
ncbi:MAG: hypothetical protein K2L17_08515 [Muribaculaceae bacterium]|nr:hypothetical protein [Muribaculaceae bacterium]